MLKVFYDLCNLCHSAIEPVAKYSLKILFICVYAGSGMNSSTAILTLTVRKYSANKKTLKTVAHKHSFNVLHSFNAYLSYVITYAQSLTLLSSKCSLLLFL